MTCQPPALCPLIRQNPAEDVLASSGSEDTEEYARPDAAQDPQAHDKDAANQARVPNEIAPTASTRSQAKEEKPAVAARPRPARGTSGEPRGRKEEEAQARPTWKRNKDIRDTSPTWRGVRPRPDVKEQTKEEAKMKLNQAGAARVRVNGTTGPYLRLGPTPPRPAGAQKSNSVISEQERKKPPEPNVAAKPKEAKPPAASLASPYRAPKPRSLSVGHTLQATIAAPHLVNPILVSLAPAPSKEETVDPVSTNAKACIMCLERVVTTVCVPYVASLESP